MKIAMLGNALANGGVTDFSEEHRKELFLRLIRELTPHHIAMQPRTTWFEILQLVGNSSTVPISAVRRVRFPSESFSRQRNSQHDGPVLRRVHLRQPR
jgi:hypothetical protein